MDTSIKTLINKVFEAQQDLTAATNKYHEALLECADTGNATFEKDGQWYQIRVRDYGNSSREPHLCLLRSSPRAWLAGPRKKPAKAVTVAEPAVPEMTREYEGETVMIHDARSLALADEASSSDEIVME